MSYCYKTSHLCGVLGPLRSPFIFINSRNSCSLISLCVCVSLRGGELDQIGVWWVVNPNKPSFLGSYFTFHRELRDLPPSSKCVYVCVFVQRPLCGHLRLFMWMSVFICVLQRFLFTLLCYLVHLLSFFHSLSLALFRFCRADFRAHLSGRCLAWCALVKHGVMGHGRLC